MSVCPYVCLYAFFFFFCFSFIEKVHTFFASALDYSHVLPAETDHNSTGCFQSYKGNIKVTLKVENNGCDPVGLIPSKIKVERGLTLKVTLYVVYISEVGYRVRGWFPTLQFDHRLCGLERADWLRSYHLTSVLPLVTAVVWVSMTMMCVRVVPAVVCMSLNTFMFVGPCGCTS